MGERNHGSAFDPDLEGMLRSFERCRAEMLAVLTELVELDTPTGDAARSRAFARRYRGLLEDAGVRCREHATSRGVHLVGDWGWAADLAGPPGVVLVGHSDTVWPAGEAARRPPRLEADRLHGPGVLDMKAGLTQALFFFRYLTGEAGAGSSRRFRIFVSADEELGSVEAQEIMAREVTAPACALVLEPPLEDGALKMYRKGVGIYALEITGTAAHAGIEPERGVSAIDELTRQILALQELRDAGRGVTVNIGTVAGGTASNVIADRAVASIDLRFDRPEDGERADGAIRSLAPHNSAVGVRVTGGLVFPPMVPTESSLREARRYAERAARLGLEVGIGRSGGGSDGSVLAARGLMTLDGLGVDGAGAHSVREHILIERLPVRTALLAATALSIGAPA